MRKKGQKCGAKTRSGQPCQRYALAGKQRCRLHGGTNPGGKKGNTNALRHGIYSDAILESELGIWDQIKLGELDDDIKLMRLRLRRLTIIQNKADEALMNGDTGRELESFQVESIVQDTDKAMVGDGSQERTLGKSTKLTKTRRDYHAEIRQLGRTIAEMEFKRSEILKRLDPEDNTNIPTKIEVVVNDARVKKEPPEIGNGGEND